MFVTTQGQEFLADRVSALERRLTEKDKEVRLLMSGNAQSRLNFDSQLILVNEKLQELNAKYESLIVEMEIMHRDIRTARADSSRRRSSDSNENSQALGVADYGNDSCESLCEDLKIASEIRDNRTVKRSITTEKEKID